MNGAATIDDVVAILASYRLRFGTEELLQCDVARALEASKILFAGEYRLGGTSRIDFYLPQSRIGIECKTQGGPSAVYQQLIRYAEFDVVAGLVLVSRRRTHATAERALVGKPFRFLWVGGGSL